MSDIDLHLINRYKYDKFPYGFIPQDGPQMEAYLSDADILLYGGAAGGGKTALMIGCGLQEHTSSIIFRREFVDIASNDGIAGSLKAAVSKVHGYTNNGYNGQAHVWTDPTNVEKMLALGALMKPGSENAYQGKARDFMGFDEAATLAEDKVRFVMGWLRTTKPGQRKRVVLATNPPKSPDEGQWLITWFAPWLDKNHPLFPYPQGSLLYAFRAIDDSLIWMHEKKYVVLTGGADRPYEYREATKEEIAGYERGDAECLENVREPKSYTFIQARVHDNKFLDSQYVKQLQDMDPLLQRAMLHGDWYAFAKDAADQVIPSEWIDLSMERWVKMREKQLRLTSQVCIAADVAEGGPDNSTVAVLRWDNSFDQILVRPGSQTPDGNAMVGFVASNMTNDCLIVVDCTGGWGGSTRDLLRNQRRRVKPYVASEASHDWTKSNLFKFNNLRSASAWRLREALDPANPTPLLLPPDPKLRQELLSLKYKTEGNKICVISKDDIRKVLGRSTDRADAVIMANYYSNMARAYLTELVESGFNSDVSRSGDFCAAPEDPLEHMR